MAKSKHYYIRRTHRYPGLILGIQFFNFVKTVKFAGKPVLSQGFETNIKLVFKEEVKNFIGYTFTDAKATYLSGNRFLPLPIQKVLQ